MAFRIPRCRVVPLPDDQVSFRVDGQERLRWHFGDRYPRPFFYPFVGPSGEALTRMGHPGAPNHDHHRSIWFGHAKVLGMDFWSDRSPARIRQTAWRAYGDGDEEATAAVRLGWFDGHDPKELVEQELIAAVRPGHEGETFVELQTTLSPTAASLEFGRTNFGFLAVRVSKTISAHFGGGKITSSTGATGEKDVFGKPAAWVDYSGPTPGGIEGITYFDHPSNARHPASWHVRDDGWMGASVCLAESISTTRERPLRLRYLLHAHADAVNGDATGAIASEFAARPQLIVVDGHKPHEQFSIRRDVET